MDWRRFGVVAAAAALCAFLVYGFFFAKRPDASQAGTTDKKIVQELSGKSQELALKAFLENPLPYAPKELGDAYKRNMSQSLQLLNTASRMVTGGNANSMSIQVSNSIAKQSEMLRSFNEMLMYVNTLYGKAKGNAELVSILDQATLSILLAQKQLDAPPDKRNPDDFNVGMETASKLVGEVEARLKTR